MIFETNGEGFYEAPHSCLNFENGPIFVEIHSTVWRASYTTAERQIRIKLATLRFFLSAIIDFDLLSSGLISVERIILMEFELEFR